MEAQAPYLKLKIVTQIANDKALIVKELHVTINEVITKLMHG